MKSYHKILLKRVESAKGNEWNIYKETRGKIESFLIVRIKDRLVLGWEYYGCYTNIEDPIQNNVDNILSGINLKEWYS